jgi:nitrogen fixation NifU-like protein
MYSPAVLDHLANPRNGGEIANPTARGEATNPVCGDRLILTFQLSEGRVERACFLAEGCSPSIAAGSVLTERIQGLTIAELQRLRPRDITEALQPLPRNKEHCSVLAIDALRAALAGCPNAAGPPTESTEREALDR